MLVWRFIELRLQKLVWMALQHWGLADSPAAGDKWRSESTASADW